MSPSAVPGLAISANAMGICSSAMMTRSLPDARPSRVAVTTPSTELSIGTTARSAAPSRTAARVAWMVGQGSLGERPLGTQVGVRHSPHDASPPSSCVPLRHGTGAGRAGPDGHVGGGGMLHGGQPLPEPGGPDRVLLFWRQRLRTGPAADDLRVGAGL